MLCIKARGSHTIQNAKSNYNSQSTVKTSSLFISSMQHHSLPPESLSFLIAPQNHTQPQLFPIPLCLCSSHKALPFRLRLSGDKDVRKTNNGGKHNTTKSPEIPCRCPEEDAGQTDEQIGPLCPRLSGCLLSRRAAESDCSQPAWHI